MASTDVMGPVEVYYTSSHTSSSSEDSMSHDSEKENSLRSVMEASDLNSSSDVVLNEVARSPNKLIQDDQTQPEDHVEAFVEKDNLFHKSIDSVKTSGSLVEPPSEQRVVPLESNTAAASDIENGSITDLPAMVKASDSSVTVNGKPAGFNTSVEEVVSTQIVHNHIVSPLEDYLLMVPSEDSKSLDGKKESSPSSAIEKIDLNLSSDVVLTEVSRSLVKLVEDVQAQYERNVERVAPLKPNTIATSDIKNDCIPALVNASDTTVAVDEKSTEFNPAKEVFSTRIVPIECPLEDFSHIVESTSLRDESAQGPNRISNETNCVQDSISDLDESILSLAQCVRSPETESPSDSPFSSPFKMKTLANSTASSEVIREIKDSDLIKNDRTPSEECLCNDCRYTMDVWSKFFRKEVITLLPPWHIVPSSDDKCDSTYSAEQPFHDHNYSQPPLQLPSNDMGSSTKPFNLLTSDLGTFFVDKSLPSVLVDLCSSSDESKTDIVWSENHEKSYTCNVCDYATSCEQYIVRHARTHKGQSKSGKIFVRPINRTSRDSSVGGNLQCNICSRIFKSKKAFVVHATWHKKTRGETVTCVEIESQSPRRRFASNDSPKTHRFKKPPQPAKCSKCFKSFRRKDMRDLHEMSCKAVSPRRKPIEEGTEIVVVVDSDVASTDPSVRVSRRRSRKHPVGSETTEGSNILRCNECDFATIVLRRLNSHLQTHQCQSVKTIKDYKTRPCPVCKAQLYGKISIVQEHIGLFHKNEMKRLFEKRRPLFLKNVTNGLCCISCKRYGFSIRGLKIHNHHFHRNEEPFGEVVVVEDEASPAKRKRDKVNWKSMKEAVAVALNDTESSEVAPLPRNERSNDVKTAVYPCKRCVKKFRTVESLTNHVKKFHRCIFNCGQCDYTTNTSDDLLAHKVMHSTMENVADEEGGRLKCSFCSYSCPHRGLFAIHMRTHKTEQKLGSNVEIQTFECGFCKFSTLDQKTLLEHRKSHVKNSSRKCPFCTFVCHSKKRFVRHLKKHRLLHSTKLLACTFCGFSTHHRGVFAVHMKAHVNSGEHSCNRCDFKTNKLSILRFHTRKHLASSGEKIYECAHCNYVTRRKRDLRIHAPLHLDLLELEETPEVFSPTNLSIQNPKQMDRQKLHTTKTTVEKRFSSVFAAGSTPVRANKNENQVTRGTKRSAEKEPELQFNDLEQTTTFSHLEKSYVVGHDEDIATFISDDEEESPIKITSVLSLAGNELQKVDSRHYQAIETVAKTVHGSRITSPPEEKKRRLCIPPKPSTVVRIDTVKKPRCFDCNTGFSNHVELAVHRMKDHDERQDSFLFADKILTSSKVVAQASELRVVDVPSPALRVVDEAPDDDDDDDDSDLEYMATYEMKETHGQVSCKECNLNFNSESFSSHMDWHATKNKKSVEKGSSSSFVNDDIERIELVSEDSDVELLTIS